MSDAYGPFYPQWRAGYVGHGPLTVTLPFVADDRQVWPLVSVRLGNWHAPLHDRFAPLVTGRRTP